MVNYSSGIIYPKGQAMFPLSLSSKGQKTKQKQQKKWDTDREDEFRSLLVASKKHEIDSHVWSIFVFFSKTHFTTLSLLDILSNLPTSNFSPCTPCSDVAVFPGQAILTVTLSHNFTMKIRFLSMKNLLWVEYYSTQTFNEENRVFLHIL